MPERSGPPVPSVLGNAPVPSSVPTLNVIIYSTKETLQKPRRQPNLYRGARYKAPDLSSSGQSRSPRQGTSETLAQPRGT